MMMQNDERKLAELILYISHKYANDPNYGLVKLNKALFFPDFNAYANWGKTISGAEYQHLNEGPAVIRLPQVLRALEDEKALVVRSVDFFGYEQKKPVNLRKPDLIHFNGQEIALVDAWIERLRPMNAREISDFSHETAAWRLTKDRETIDPRYVFIAWREPNAAEIARGRELAAKHGLLA